MFPHYYQQLSTEEADVLPSYALGRLCSQRRQVGHSIRACPIRYPRLMHATRACRRAAALLSTSSLTCRLPSSCSLVSRHLERILVLSRSPPRLPTLTSDSVSSSRRNLSTSTPPRRAQYSRFDDDPNHPPPHSRGFQKRDIIIYTLGAGSAVYYIFQCVISRSSTSPSNVWFRTVSNKSQRRVDGASWM
jgi:hypothetical protein